MIEHMFDIRQDLDGLDADATLAYAAAADAALNAAEVAGIPRESPPAAPAGNRRRDSRPPATLYVHLTDQTLDTALEGGIHGGGRPGIGVARV